MPSRLSIYCLVVSSLFIGSQASPAFAVQYTKPVDSTMIDGIKIQTPTRVQAGKPFQVKLVSKKEKINGICWWNWEISYGFDVPNEVKMKKGVTKVRLLPIQPGAASMSFYCGTNRGNPKIGGSARIFIAP